MASRSRVGGLPGPASFRLIIFATCASGRENVWVPKVRSVGLPRSFSTFAFSVPRSAARTLAVFMVTIAIEVDLPARSTIAARVAAMSSASPSEPGVISDREPTILALASTAGRLTLGASPAR